MVDLEDIQSAIRKATIHNDSEIQKSYEFEYKNLNKQFYDMRVMSEEKKKELKNNLKKIHLEHHKKIKEQLDNETINEAISAVNELNNVKNLLETNRIEKDNNKRPEDLPKRKWYSSSPTQAEIEEHDRLYDEWDSKKDRLEEEGRELQEIIDKLEPLKEIYEPETTGGKRKTRRNRKSKKSIKGKSRKNRRKSKSHR
jgi:hypothetical protein|tara:strand:- start:604 stop:1197 length:594 start_codon:yes stop_codon:yes gene_type:complete